MITYYDLQNLLNGCMELFSESCILSRNIEDRQIMKLNEQILQSTRKIVIANELWGKGIICISGLQGAGKTTMMKNFYGISDEILDISLGRGENMPIFICEKGNCTGEEMYAVCLSKNENNNYNRNTLQLDADRFIRASRGERIGEDSEIMYLELHVPYQHFRNESFAFLLLPGFEKRKNYWQNLLEFSVKCSDSSVFVCNEASLASFENEELRKEIESQFGSKLIYALSHADQSRDGNAEAKVTLMERMHITQAEANRVVCVGDYDDADKNREWIEKLKEAINLYCVSLDSARGNCASYIYDIIMNEISPALMGIREAVMIERTDMEDEKGAVEKLLETHFDKQVRKRRRQFKKSLESALGRSVETCNQRLLVKHKNTPGGLDTVRRVIFGENIKDIERCREYIQSSLKHSNNGEEVYEYQIAIVEAMEEIARDVGNTNSFRTLIKNNQKNSNLPVEQKEKDESGISDQQKRILHDVRYLLAPALQENDILQYDNSGKILEIIPEMGIQYLALSGLIQGDGNYLDTILEQYEVKGVDWDKIQKSYEGKMNNVTKVLVGTVGIAGMDLVGDGVLNLVPALAESLGLSNPVTAGAVLTVMGVALSVSIISDVNRLQRTELAAGENAIRSVHERVQSELLQLYDDKMNDLRERVKDRLSEAMGVDRRKTNTLKALMTLEQIEKQLDDIEQKVSEETYGLGNAFV